MGFPVTDIHPHSSFDFVSCLQVLTSIHHDLDINVSDFLQKKSLLELPKTHHVNNPIISGPSLLIIQTLQHLVLLSKQ
jgi:hypothetical protein